MEKTIFIVDDEPAILKLITHWVKNEWEYNVRTFTNGSELLENIYENPDLILLDIMLPDLSGTELLKRIKRMNKHLPVIMLSAQGNIDVALECIREGAFDYFSRSFGYQTIILVRYHNLMMCDNIMVMICYI